MNIENPIIQQLINAFFIIIPLGGVARIIHCAMTSMHDEEKRPEAIRRIKNVIGFVIFAEVVVGIINLVYQYYS